MDLLRLLHDPLWQFIITFTFTIIMSIISTYISIFIFLKT